jgi:hypothetical protein
VWADELSRRSLFDAFTARRTYALTGARIVLRFYVNGRPMGSEIAASGDYRLEAEVYAPSEIKEVQFLKNAELVHKKAIGDTCIKAVYTDTGVSDSGLFYHCRIVLSDGNLAVSSPVWIS